MSLFLSWSTFPHIIIPIFHLRKLDDKTTEELSTLIKLGRGRARICSQVFRSQSADPITRPRRSEDEPQAAQATPWALGRLHRTAQCPWAAGPTVPRAPRGPLRSSPTPRSIRVPCTYSNGCTDQTYNLTTCLIFDHFVGGAWPRVQRPVGAGIKRWSCL